MLSIVSKQQKNCFNSLKNIVILSFRTTIRINFVFGFLHFHFHHAIVNMYLYYTYIHWSREWWKNRDVEEERKNTHEENSENSMGLQLSWFWLHQQSVLTCEFLVTAVRISLSNAYWHCHFAFHSLYYLISLLISSSSTVPFLPFSVVFVIVAFVVFVYCDGKTILQML